MLRCWTSSLFGPRLMLLLELLRVTLRVLGGLAWALFLSWRESERAWRAGTPLTVHAGAKSPSKPAKKSCEVPVSSKKSSDIPVSSAPADPSLKRKRGILLSDLCNIHPLLRKSSIDQGTALVDFCAEALGESSEALDVEDLAMQNVSAQHEALGRAVMVGHKVRILKAKLVQQDQERVFKDFEDALNREREGHAATRAMLEDKEAENDRLAQEVVELKQVAVDAEAAMFKAATYYNSLGRIEILREPMEAVSLEREIQEFKRLSPDQDLLEASTVAASVHVHPNLEPSVDAVTQTAETGGCQISK